MITKALDPQVQAIFDAMFAFMDAQDVPTCNAWANRVGNGISYGISATAFDGSQLSNTYFAPGTKVMVAPSNPMLGPNGTQQFTASATDVDGVEIAGATFTWKMQAGSFGTISATGLYTAPASIPAQTLAVVVATLSDSSAWSSANITLMP